MEQVKFNEEVLTPLDNDVTYKDSQGNVYIRTGKYTLLDKKEYKTHIIGQSTKKYRKNTRS